MVSPQPAISNDIAIAISQGEAPAPPRRRQARAELAASEPMWEGNETRAYWFLHPAMSFDERVKLKVSPPKCDCRHELLNENIAVSMST